MSYINKPAKDTAWRTKVLKNLAGDVIINKNNKVITSPPLAFGLTKVLSKLITLAKKNTLHSRRQALRYIGEKKHLGTLEILFTVLRERYQGRNGGYTRISKIYRSRGDNAPRVEFSLV